MYREFDGQRDGAARRDIIGRIHRPKHDVFNETPRTAFQARYGDNARSYPTDVSRDGTPKIVSSRGSALIDDQAAESCADRQQTRAFERFHVETIGEVVRKDAAVAFVRRKYFVEANP